MFASLYALENLDDLKNWNVTNGTNLIVYLAGTNC